LTYDKKFTYAKLVGNIGEAFTLGYLRSEYKHSKIQTVEEYYGKGYRWKNKCLPDYLITPTEGRRILVEVKCKKGWKQMMNIELKDVQDYLYIAQATDCDFFLLFFFLYDNYVYKLTPETLKKPTNRERNSNGVDFLCYDPENIEKFIPHQVPTGIFNRDIMEYI
jgi:hypothetical protein